MMYRYKRIYRYWTFLTPFSLIIFQTYIISFSIIKSTLFLHINFMITTTIFFIFLSCFLLYLSFKRSEYLSEIYVNEVGLKAFVIKKIKEKGYFFVFEGNKEFICWEDILHVITFEKKDIKHNPNWKGGIKLITIKGDILIWKDLIGYKHLLEDISKYKSDKR